jgi:hypothetical protein
MAAPGHYCLYVENGGSIEAFLSFFLNPLSIFFASFLAAFFSILDFLLFLAIWCGPPILVAASWTAQCASQAHRFFKSAFWRLTDKSVLPIFGPLLDNSGHRRGLA